MSCLILPGDPLFNETLASPPPDWGAHRDQYHGACHYVVRPGSMLMEAVSPGELEEYLNGGEYDERLEEIGDDIKGGEECQVSPIYLTTDPGLW